MATRIPQGWRNAVTQILRAPRGNFLIRRSARRDWCDMFPGDFDYDRNEAIAAAIEDPTLLGRQVFGMEEPGDVYEFIFSHRSRNVYAKINLQPNVQCDRLLRASPAEG